MDPALNGRQRAGARPRVALVPWGTPIEFFLDPLHRTVDDFCERLEGGWLFGYATALASAGYAPSIILSSRDVDDIERRSHVPTGTPIVVLPWKATERSFKPGLRHDLQAYRRALPRGMTTVLVQYAAVLVQEYEEPRADLLAWWGRLRRIPVLGTFQGGIPPWEAAPLQRLVRRPSLHRFAGLLAGSAEEAKRLIEERGADPRRVHRVANPVDIETWTPHDRATARRRLDIPDDALVVAWHGRVDVARKGLDVLLDAWQQVREALPDRDLRLLLTGSGPDDARLRELLGDNSGEMGVDWLAEYARPARIRERLAACDVWVSASRHEGFAVAPLEAMASGRAVVLTDAPGAAELLGDAAAECLVPLADTCALAAAIVRLTEPERSTSLGVWARRRAEQYFSEATVARELRSALTAAGCRS
jgi:glycosyltransferase involved in cell wall biosynthesis